jgi:endonuclease VIII
MPEGPSIVILKEAVQAFTGQKVTEVSGNTKEPVQQVAGKKVLSFRSWGKHFLICFADCTIRIHFMLFGSYRINEEKASPPRLSLRFAKGVLHFYACSVKIFTEDPDTVYDWSADIMSDTWDPAAARKKLKQQPDTLACDALLDQQIFSGSGNIIKNEVLYRVKIHPESTIGNIPPPRLSALIRETRQYAFDFLEWKKQYVLKQHWLAHTKKICQRCNLPLIKRYCGKTNRRTFYCDNCQVRYG